MIGIREATPADRDAILALRKRCFPDEDIEKQGPRFWDWEFRDGRMFVAETGERVVSHLGFVPRSYTIEGRRVDGALAVDAMTDPEFRRQRLFDRVAAVARDAIRRDFRISTAWQIRSAVLPAMVKNGWEPTAVAPVFVRPVLMKGLRTRTRAGVRRSSFDVNPYWRYERFEDGEAFVVTRRVTLKGFDTLAITNVSPNARPLLRDVLAHARELRVTLVAALMTLRHPALPLLLTSGFLPSPHRFRLLVNAFDETIHPRRVRWALTWADTDHL